MLIEKFKKKISQIKKATLLGHRDKDKDFIYVKGREKKEQVSSKCYKYNEGLMKGQLKQTYTSRKKLIDLLFGIIPTKKNNIRY